jgi:hypothetical protein
MKLTSRVTFSHDWENDDSFSQIETATLKSWKMPRSVHRDGPTLSAVRSKKTDHGCN